MFTASTFTVVAILIAVAMFVGGIIWAVKEAATRLWAVLLCVGGISVVLVGLPYVFTGVPESSWLSFLSVFVNWLSDNAPTVYAIIGGLLAVGGIYVAASFSGPTDVVGGTFYAAGSQRQLGAGFIVWIIAAAVLGFSWWLSAAGMNENFTKLETAIANREVEIGDGAYLVDRKAHGMSRYLLRIKANKLGAEKAILIAKLQKKNDDLSDGHSQKGITDLKIIWVAYCSDDNQNFTRILVKITGTLPKNKDHGRSKDEEVKLIVPMPYTASLKETNDMLKKLKGIIVGDTDNSVPKILKDPAEEDDVSYGNDDGDTHLPVEAEETFGIGTSD